MQNEITKNQDVIKYHIKLPRNNCYGEKLLWKIACGILTSYIKLYKLYKVCQWLATGQLFSLKLYKLYKVCQWLATGQLFSLKLYKLYKVCQWLVTGQLFSQGTPASSSN